MSTMTASPESSQALYNTLRSYYNMMKPTVGLLVVITAIPTMFMAARSVPSTWTLLITLLGTFFATGSAGVFNHLVDSDIDGDMERTKKRPLPSGNVNKKLAFVFAVSLGIASFAMLYAYTSPLAAYTALAANFFYVVIYTMILKKEALFRILLLAVLQAQ